MGAISTFRLRVKVGATRRSQKKDIQEIDVARKIKHENYISKQGTFDNDIALLKLAHPVKMKSRYMLSFIYPSREPLKNAACDRVLSIFQFKALQVDSIPFAFLSMKFQEKHTKQKY